MKKISPIALLVVILSGGIALGLWQALNLLKNPSPFPSSHWDLRWVGGYGLAFLGITLGYWVKRVRWLLYAALALLLALFLIPLFTLGILKTYLALGGLFVVAFGIGSWSFVRLLGYKSVATLDDIVLAVLLGLGGLMVLRSIQGAVGAFSTPWTWLGLAGLALLFVPSQFKMWITQSRASKFWESLKLWPEEKRQFIFSLLTAGVFLWGASWLIALAPPTRYDELTYHVAGPSYYLRQGGIVPYPEGSNNPWLHYVEMLYSLGLELVGEASPRLFHLSMALASSGLVFLLGRKLINGRAGLVAAMLFFSLPVVAYEGATAYIDLFVTAYTTAAAYALVSWYLEGGENRWLVVFGVFAGLAIGMKLTAAPVVAVMLLAILGVGLIGHPRPRLKMFALVSGIVLLLSAPWFIRDWLWTGDPFFPYGQWLWVKIFPSLSPSVVVPSPSVGSLGETALRLLRYPLDLVFDSRRYYHEAPGGMVVALPILAVPVFLFSERLSKTTRKILAVALGMSVLAVGLMFFANNALLRYALPVFPWLALAAGANFEALFQALESLPKAKPGLFLVLVLVLVYLFSTRPPFIVRIWENLPQRLPVNYFLGRESREAYLSRTLPVYDAYRFIDTQPGGRHRVLSVGNEFRLYTQSRIDGVYDVAEAQNLLVSAQNEAELAAQLKEHGYDFVLINQPEVEYVSWKYAYPILQQSDFLNRYAELVFAQKGIYVYQLRPEGVKLISPNNLLSNAGFEEINAENPSSWGREGTILLSNDALEGEWAVLLYGPLSSNGFGYLWQQVPIEEGKIYTVGYWLRAYSHQPALFLMRVAWLDQSGQFIGGEEFWKNVTSDWEWYYFHTKAPNEARFARVYGSAGGDQGVLMDAVCMAEGQRCPSLTKQDH